MCHNSYTHGVNGRKMMGLRVNDIFILLFKGSFLFEILIFLFKNVFTPLCLSKNKTKGQSDKNYNSNSH